MELNKAQKQQQRQQHRVDSTHDQRWKPPTNGLYMMNFDGAVDKDRKLSGIGLIIGDAENQIMGGYSDRVQWIGNSFTVEALTATWELDFAKEMGLNEIILGDAISVIAKLQTKSEDLSRIGSIVEEGRNKAVQVKVLQYKTYEENRNETAHRLAKHELQNDEGM
ncbi:uncharacterized protein LOC111317854 [Durio zibethinus]|uniref:Uncharacterized protein LOC111317854 n=1 Tax=Durio zibethinus TaxID=66656 RepID=A0A6P6BG67_DURZI|nr:uncharacterized protein LOC111317854 [Durio zibethinus]XP_022776065.1 uncharacterized protein LOC111317854 [Durio zibethinus]